ncbi:MAG: isoprenylcysteine carboxylmethyltransferase family protein [Armatimonadetes bacterium]|nr:isoprenylcysteine carboxylmethyltransferase family protein [Armatimonadota bacterium]
MNSPFETVYIVGLVLGSLIRAVYTRGRRSRRILTSRCHALDSVLLLLAGVGMIPVPIVALTTDWLSFGGYTTPPIVGCAGTVLLAAALWLLWRSHRDLGSNWSARIDVRDGQALVVTGVYSRIRHPMYAAHWLWAMAQLLLIQNWLAGPAMLVFYTPLYFLRVGQEEALMREHFGQPYEDYMARTGRVLPRLGARRVD